MALFAKTVNEINIVKVSTAITTDPQINAAP